MRRSLFLVVLLFGGVAHTAPEPPPAEVARRAPRPAPAPAKITLDVKDAELPNVLRLFADVGRLNLVIDDAVKGSVTIKLRDVPWPDALAVVLRTKGLGQVRDGDVVTIRPQRALDAAESAALDRAAERALKGALVTRIVPVANADAAEMATVVRGMLTARGSVTVAGRSNTLAVRDVAGSPAFTAVP